jgi:general secretion pathway protein N
MNRGWRRIRQALPWCLVGLAASAATLIAMAPAYWFTPAVARYSDRRVELVDPHGSLWQGDAILQLAPGRADPNGPPRAGGAPSALPGRLAWHTAFWPLLLGRLRIEIEQDEALAHPVQLAVDWRQATLGEGRLTLPASWLNGLGSPFNTLDLRGSVALSWGDCLAHDGQVYGHLVLTLDRLASRISRVQPLGSYRLQIDLDGQGALLRLSTLQGALLLDGRGQVNAAHFGFEGSARAAPGYQDSLAGFLTLLGDPRGDGSYSLHAMP